MLKKAWPNLKVFAVEPTLSPVLSGGAPGPHPIQGIGAGFVPSISTSSLLDGVIQVDADDAKEMARRAAREEGMLVGISSGATLAGDRAEARRAGRAASASSASTTIPASAICRCRTSFPKRLKPALTAFLCFGVNSAPLNWSPSA